MKKTDNVELEKELREELDNENKIIILFLKFSIIGTLLLFATMYFKY